MKEEGFKSFRENLSALIDSRGLTYARLAEEAGLTPATISRYMAGDRTPDLFCAMKIADYFGISLDWLLGRGGGRYDELPEQLRATAEAYAAASVDDRYVVDAVLKKYK